MVSTKWFSFRYSMSTEGLVREDTQIKKVIFLMALKLRSKPPPPLELSGNQNYFKDEEKNQK